MLTKIRHPINKALVLPSTDAQFPFEQQQKIFALNECRLHHLQSLALRLRDTGCMDTWRCTHKRLKMYCEQLAKNCSTVYHFSRTIQVFSGENSFQSGQQSNLYHLLNGLTKAFCNISVMVFKILRFKHTRLIFQR